MKKLYTEINFKKYSIKRAKKELNKKIKRKNKKKNLQSKKSFLIKRFHKNRSKKRERIILPTNFSIINNPDETLNFFLKFDNILRKDGKKLFFDMSNIKKLSLDAVLYILSMLDFYKLKEYPFDIKGNTPNDEKCRDIFLKSGFFNYVKSPYSNKNVPSETKNILQITSGNLVECEVAKKIVDFVLNHLSQQVSLKSKGIYRIILEMMGNTRNHAFRISDRVSKWYLITYYDSIEEQVVFSFLDGGFGIPATIRRSTIDDIKEFAKKFVQKKHDAILLKSALNGEHRTRTEKGYRGKGLPSIYNCSQKGYIKDLTIVSSYGFVRGPKLHNLNTKFNGTLYTWVFI